MEQARIAVAGAGTIGLRHIEEIGRSGGATLAAIVDVSAPARDVAARAAVPFYGSIGALLAAMRPDGVIIATPNALHVEQALQCVTAGIPTLVEKPIGRDVEEATRLVEAAGRANVPLLVGHHRRHSPILEQAVELVRSGTLGRIVAVQGSAAFIKPAAYFSGANAWRREPGGGPILLNLIHEIDDLRAMVGEIEAVQAFTSHAVRGFDVEDTAAIVLRFANGALGSFLLSDTAASPASWEQTSGENAAYAHCGDVDAYTIMGTHGSLGVPTMRVWRYADGAERSWFTPFQTHAHATSRADPLARQIAHFVAVIRGEAAPRVSGRDGLQNLRITTAIAEAARSGRVVATHAPRGERLAPLDDAPTRPP